MALLNANASYWENQVTTASRGQLLLMTYDGILRFLADGRRAIAAQDYEAQSASLGKAQQLLLELLQTLDPQACPELAERLASLYHYMLDRLITANVNDDEAPVMEVARLTAQLREAWAEAEHLSRCQSSTPQPAMAGGYTG